MSESKKAIPEPNFFQCPNIIIDEYLKELSGSELKCFLLVVRKTKGWHKDFDAISISQFEEFTGLSNRAVIDACNSLVGRGFIYQDVGQRGVKLFSLDCKKFTSEKSSHVKKSHSTSEKSSQVTSEKSSHTKESVKYTNENKNNNNASDKKNDFIYTSPSRRFFKITPDWKPEPTTWAQTMNVSQHLVKKEQFTDYSLAEFIRTNLGKEEKTEHDWQRFYVNALARGYIKSSADSQEPKKQGRYQQQQNEPRMNIPLYVPEPPKEQIVRPRTTALTDIFKN